MSKSRKSAAEEWQSLELLLQAVNEHNIRYGTRWDIKSASHAELELPVTGFIAVVHVGVVEFRDVVQEPTEGCSLQVRTERGLVLTSIPFHGPGGEPYRLALERARVFM